jgi:hypothetical protein
MINKLGLTNIEAFRDQAFWFHTPTPPKYPRSSNKSKKGAEIFTKKWVPIGLKNRFENFY